MTKICKTKNSITASVPTVHFLSCKVPVITVKALSSTSPPYQYNIYEQDRFTRYYLCSTLQHVLKERCELLFCKLLFYFWILLQVIHMICSVVCHQKWCWQGADSETKKKHLTNALFEKKENWFSILNVKLYSLGFSIAISSTVAFRCTGVIRYQQHRPALLCVTALIAQTNTY